jgi:hypothetical protein
MSFRRCSDGTGASRTVSSTDCPGKSRSRSELMTRTHCGCRRIGSRDLSTRSESESKSLACRIVCARVACDHFDCFDRGCASCTDHRHSGRNQTRSGAVRVPENSVVFSLAIHVTSRVESRLGSRLAGRSLSGICNRDVCGINLSTQRLLGLVIAEGSIDRTKGYVS